MVLPELLRIASEKAGGEASSFLSRVFNGGEVRTLAIDYIDPVVDIAEVARRGGAPA